MGRVLDYRVVAKTDVTYWPADGSKSTYTGYAVQYLWEYKSWFGLGRLRRVWKLCTRSVAYEPGWVVETFATREAAEVFIHEEQNPPRDKFGVWAPLTEE